MSNLSVPVFNLNGKKSRTQKYVEVFITDSLKDDDMCHQIKSVYAKGNILVCEFYKCSTEVQSRNLDRRDCNSQKCI